MKLHRLQVLALFASTLSSAPAQAQIQTFSTGWTNLAVPGSANTPLPAFDAALGILRWADITVTGLVSGSLSLENTNAFSVGNGVSYPGAYVHVSTDFASYAPPASPAFESDQYSPAPPAMAPFDGTLDFQGPSSTTYAFTGQAGSGGPTKTYGPFLGAALMPFRGPFVLNFHLQTVDYLIATVPSGVMTSYSLTAQALITIRYGYEPLPTAICLPAYSNSCPCGTQQLTDRGCANSVSGGAGLDLSGTASITADSLVLQGSSMPDGPVLYIQGDSYTLGPIAFGDGLLCIVGNIRRLAIRFNTGGASSYPGVGEPSLSVLGAVSAPGDRYYQAYYRDTASFCTSATFNLTNGFAVRWQP